MHVWLDWVGWEHILRIHECLHASIHIQSYAHQIGLMCINIYLHIRIEITPIILPFVHTYIHICLTFQGIHQSVYIHAWMQLYQYKASFALHETYLSKLYPSICTGQKEYAYVCYIPQHYSIWCIQNMQESHVHTRTHNCKYLRNVYFGLSPWSPWIYRHKHRTDRASAFTYSSVWISICAVCVSMPPHSRVHTCVHVVVCQLQDSPPLKFIFSWNCMYPCLWIHTQNTRKASTHLRDKSFAPEGIEGQLSHWCLPNTRLWEPAQSAASSSS